MMVYLGNKDFNVISYEFFFNGMIFVLLCYIVFLNIYKILVLINFNDL